MGYIFLFSGIAETFFGDKDIFSFMSLLWFCLEEGLNGMVGSRIGLLLVGTEAYFCYGLNVTIPVISLE